MLRIFLLAVCGEVLVSIGGFFFSIVWFYWFVSCLFYIHKGVLFFTPYN